MKTSVNIKVEENIRNEAKELFGKMGLDMTTAVNLFLIAAIREKGLPFSLTTLSDNEDERQYEKYWAEKLRRAEAQEKAGKMRNFDSFSTEIMRKYGF